MILYFIMDDIPCSGFCVLMVCAVPYLIFIYYMSYITQKNTISKKLLRKEILHTKVGPGTITQILCHPILSPWNCFSYSFCLLS
jgi:hypothetical protein